jgi:hypothetical protein
MERLVALLLVGAGIVVAPTALGATGGSSAGSAGSVRIASSLDGRTSLPPRIRWIATPTGGDVSVVDFLIDGKLIWTEHKAPYVFDGDDNGANEGYSITTWLTPGSHQFSARATTSDGETVSDTVKARVEQPPPPPAALAGFWTRVVTAQDLKKGDSSNGPPAGRWTLVFDRVGAWHLDPMGSGVANEYAVHGHVIDVYAPIQMAPSENGRGGVSKYGHHDIGGTDCTAAGPFGSYHWSVSANTLVLKAIREGCGNRRAIWQGTWTKR